MAQNPSFPLYLFIVKTPQNGTACLFYIRWAPPMYLLNILEVDEMGEYKEGYVGGYGSGFTLVVVSFILLITASGAYIGWR
ncbi:hypothetical protein BTO30_00885 [Domibacillus antri]|uniref:Sporulation protein YjcZ n=1 Tax=Domibacillus antri TaxID=1714264 RepID=A0A1Q8Q9I9_9BACI|nr:hypothetical protein BTO30_00885 [Domibacillus antri]